MTSPKPDDVSADDADVSGDDDICCQLPEFEQERRRRGIGQFLFSATQEHQELSDGYRFRYPSDPLIARTLLAFVVRERDCCPHFRFQLEFPPEQGPIWLSLRGGEEVKAFIADELEKIAETGKN